MMATKRRTDRAPRLVGYAVLAVLLAAVLEVFSFLAVSATRRDWFSYSKLQAARTSIGAGPESAAASREPSLPGFIANEVIHPYLGFVLDRSFERCSPTLPGYRDILDYGFQCSDVPMLQRRTPGKVIVGLFGGSVAYGLPAHVIGPLREELSRSPRFSGKSIVLVPMALPGYKQPQQLLTLTYFLMLGAEFDLLINLDGFNDVVLPAVENVPKGVFPLFPRSWYFRAGALDPATRARMGQVAYLRDRRAAHARWFSRAPMRYSTTTALLWTLLDRADVAHAETVQARMLKQRTDEGTFVQTGPQRSYPDERAMYSEFAATWQRSSLQMHRLANANGATYVHFLQPNQYVAGSKPIGDEERKRALTDAFGFRRSVEVGYPLLQAMGRELVGQGVHFHDMTRVFAAEPRPVYVDPCCHFDATGFEVLARAMSRAILADTGADLR